MISIAQFAKYVRRIRKQMRHGEFSREPVRILRLEWRPDVVECDWLMRPSDPWDAYVSPRVAKQNMTSQALRDALTIRNMIFKGFPGAPKAELRMFRLDADQQLELMMTGSVARNDQLYDRVPSVAMRAKLCGFQFTVAHGALQPRS